MFHVPSFLPSFTYFFAYFLLYFSYFLFLIYHYLFSYFHLSGISVKVGSTYTDIDDRTDIEYFKNMERSFCLFVSIETEKENNMKNSSETECDRKEERKEELFGSLVAQDVFDNGCHKHDKSSVGEDVLVKSNYISEYNDQNNGIKSNTENETLAFKTNCCRTRDFIKQLL